MTATSAPRRSRSRPSRWIESEGSIAIESHEVAYRVIRSRRARRVALRLPVRGCLELVLPLGLRAGSPEDLLRDHAGWIAARLAERDSVTRRPLRHGDRIPYRGGHLIVEASPGNATIARDGDRLLCGQTQFDLDSVVEAWLRGQARRVLSMEVAKASRSMAVCARRITVRDQRTRWGSCSTAGNLSFSWRLILAPDDVLRYVVVHEVAHLLEPNHGPRFWAVVQEHCPDYQRHRRWLREHGDSLVLSPAS